MGLLGPHTILTVFPSVNVSIIKLDSKACLGEMVLGPVPLVQQEVGGGGGLHLSLSAAKKRGFTVVSLGHAWIVVKRKKQQKEHNKREAYPKSVAAASIFLVLPRY